MITPREVVYALTKKLTQITDEQREAYSEDVIKAFDERIKECNELAAIRRNSYHYINRRVTKEIIDNIAGKDHDPALDNFIGHFVTVFRSKLSKKIVSLETQLRAMSVDHPNLYHFHNRKNNLKTRILRVNRLVGHITRTGNNLVSKVECMMECYMGIPNYIRLDFYRDMHKTWVTNLDAMLETMASGKTPVEAINALYKRTPHDLEEVLLNELDKYVDTPVDLQSIITKWVVDLEVEIRELLAQYPRVETLFPPIKFIS